MEEQVIQNAKILAESILNSETWLNYLTQKQNLMEKDLYQPMLECDQAALLLKSGKKKWEKDALAVLADGEDILQHADVQEYRKAEQALNLLIANVNHTILHFLGDERSEKSNCSGNCQTCSGCMK